MSKRELLRYEALRLRRQGLSNRSIARALGMDRRTVGRLLAEARAARSEDVDTIQSVPRYATRASKLDPHRSLIADLLRKHPDITATRVLEELEARGYDGGYTIVRECVRQLRPTPAPVARATRVETPPGRQAQADFSPYRLADGTELHAFSVVLAHSRYLYVDFTADERQATVFRQMVAAFELFGGVPEEVVFDSMPGIVDRWELDGPVLNLRALDFAAHYDFAYHIAPRADGAYKGKVERPFRYMETNFFNGRVLHSFEHARAALRAWRDTRANMRTHAATRRVPVDDLERERPSLMPLPARPYDTREVGYRIVDGYGRVHFDGNTYSTPISLSGRRVVVRADARCIEILDRVGTRLCEHERAARGARLDVVAPEHVRRTRAVSHDQLVEVYREWGPSAEAFAHAVIERQRYRRKHLAAVLALQGRFAVDDIVAALEHAMRYGAHDAASVERILEAKATPTGPADRIAAAVKRRVRQTFDQTPVSKREPAEYARIVGSIPTPGMETDHGNEEDKQPPTAD